MSARFSLLPLVGAVLLGGCQTGASQLPEGPEAYKVIPAPDLTVVRPYRIGPQDVLSVNVFREPDLSFPQVQVDAGGDVVFPLVGRVKAEGATAQEFAGLLAERLNRDYLRDAQVSVIVVNAASQTVTVEGSVIEPGVYEIGGSSTLLKAVARAKSPTRTAKLDEVVIFRVVNGQRMGARFDLRAIREGRAPDPELLGGDVVVIGFDAVKGAFRDFLTTAPFFNIFAQF